MLKARVKYIVIKIFMQRFSTTMSQLAMAHVPTIIDDINTLHCIYVGIHSQWT